MMYFEDMSSKWGFNDGEAVPPGAAVYRKVYVLVMNTLLKKHNSLVRLVAYDRGGVHNWCLVLLVPREMADSLSMDEIVSGSFNPSVEFEEATPDSLYDAAIQEAMGLNLDTWVDVKVGLTTGVHDIS